MSEDVRLSLSHLSLLQEDPSDSVSQEIDIEVSEFINSGVLAEHVQYVGVLKLETTAHLQEFARKIAATANSALLHFAEFGFLIFDVQGTRIRNNFRDPLSAYSTINSTDKGSVAHSERLLTNLVYNLLIPLPEVKIVCSADNVYAYLRIIPPKPQFSVLQRMQEGSEIDLWRPDQPIQTLPTFTTSNEISGILDTRLLVWQQSDETGSKPRWRCQEAKPHQYRVLFEKYVEASYGEINIGMIEKISNEKINSLKAQIIQKQFHSIQDFILFLTELLLGGDEWRRQVAVRTFRYFAPINKSVNLRVPQLLLGCLIDEEQQVITQAIDSLAYLGDERCYHFLRRNFSLFVNSPDVQRHILACLGLLSPPDNCIEDFVKLWTETLNQDSLEIAFNQAITQVYNRHKLPRYKQPVREDLYQYIFSHRYEDALTLFNAYKHKICLVQEHQHKVQALIRYGYHRLRTEFELAANILEPPENQAPFVDDDSSSFLSNYRTEIQELLNDLSADECKLVGMVFDLEIQANADDLSDFATRVYAIVNVLAEHLATQFGVQFRGSNSKHLSSLWVDANPAIISDLSTGKPEPSRSKADKIKKMKVDRLLIADLFVAFTNQPGIDKNKLDSAVKIIRELNPLVELRNKSRASHNANVVKKEEVTALLVNGAVEVQSKLREFLKLVVKKDIILTSYRELNEHIKKCFVQSDNFDISIRVICELSHTG